MQLSRFIAAAALTGALATSVVLAQSAGTKKVRITYQNLTTGQAFSPSVFMSHNGSAPKLFGMGTKASPGLARLAEDGNVAPIADMAGKMMGRAMGMSDIGLPTMPGGTGMVELTVDRSHPMISGGWMLSMTNDGFTGLSGVNAYELREPRTIDVVAYDAGSEKNNERRPYLVALMGIQRDPDGGVVTRHKGIRGDADAPAAWKFDPKRPVARVTITPL
jgi:hypothetical protein